MHMGIFARLEARRRDIGMSNEILSRISGVSTASVVRILSGKQANASFAHVQAIADALEVDLVDRERICTYEIRKRQAMARAQQVMALLQGTSGLEGQAVDEVAFKCMYEQTVAELMAGSKRKLWSDDEQLWKRCQARRQSILQG